MNIFILDKNTDKSARYLCDKHCSKMILESAQMLSTAHWLKSDYTDELYKPTHINHPCSIWTRESIENYIWHFEYMRSMASEFKERFGKSHGSFNLLNVRLSNVPEKIKDKNITTFPLAMPDKYKKECPIDSYRSYYIGEKLKFANWSAPASVPYWILTALNHKPHD